MRFKNQHRITDVKFEQIIEKIANNISITQACNECCMSPQFFRHLLNTDTLFRQQFDEARAFAAECKTDELYDIAKDCQNPIELGAAKLASENIRWLASKRARDTYGEKMEMNVNQTLDISKVLDAAQQRLGPILDLQKNVTQSISTQSISYDEIYAGQKPVTSPKKSESIDDLL